MRLAHLPLLLSLLPIAKAAADKPACARRAEAVRAMGTGEGLPPMDQILDKQPWVYSITPAVAPRAETGYRDDIDSVNAIVEAFAADELRIRVPVNAPSKKLGRDLAALRRELAGLTKGARVALALDEKLPASLLADIVHAVPDGVQAGLVVRKPGAVLAAAHQKAFPSSPPDLQEVLARSFDQAGTRIMVYTADAYIAQLVALSKPCPLANDVFAKAAKGEGYDVMMPMLADAALACGCDRLDLDRAVSLLTFWTCFYNRDNSFLPLPRDLTAGKGQTVADLVRELTKARP